MLCFVVAMRPEARPLIRHYGLQQDPGCDLFRVYRRDGIALVVAGIGKVRAAAATACLGLTVNGRDAVWINVGVAGHGEREVGEAVLAHTVRDAATGRTWRPEIAFASPTPTDEVITVDDVERDFRRPAAYEMEAAGFYPIARRFSGPDRVHCLKVISDGPGVAPESLTRDRLASLIEGRLETVGKLVGELRRILG